MAFVYILQQWDFSADVFNKLISIVQYLRILLVGFLSIPAAPCLLNTQFSCLWSCFLCLEAWLVLGVHATFHPSFLYIFCVWLVFLCPKACASDFKPIEALTNAWSWVIALFQLRRIRHRSHSSVIKLFTAIGIRWQGSVLHNSCFDYNCQVMIIIAKSKILMIHLCYLDCAPVPGRIISERITSPQCRSVQ